MRLSLKTTILLISTCLLSWGQGVSSSVTGTIADPTGAVVPGAVCTLTNAATGQTSSAPTQADGGFAFANVIPGTYHLTVTAPGFKTLTMEKVNVTASEVRTLGRMTLNVGETKESVTVAAEAAPIQLGSAERSGLVTGSQLNEIAIKGRDLMSFLATIPGVVDLSAGAGRESVDPNAAVNITINGNASNQKNVTVDGINVLDTGNNTGMHYEPNMDAVQEVKILSSNYQAEHGRMGGGAITIITKGGSRDFHGSAYEFYRHESLNANDFFSNRSNTAKTPYRYRITGYSLGGPVFIPGKLNANKEKLFFFFSQEFSGIKQDRGFRRTNMPTELERQGNFSQSYDLSGTLIKIKDPTQPGTFFTNNIIPASRWNAKGQAVLSQFPLPNYTDPDPNGRYSWNYRDSSSSPYPKRQEIGRIDYNPKPWIRIFGRFVNSKDEQQNYYGSWTTGGTNFKLYPVKYGIPGRGVSGTVTLTISPTFISETTFGQDQNGIDIDAVDPAPIQRAKWGDLPKWYSFQYVDGVTNPDYAPDITFGGQPVNTPVLNVGGRLPWKNISRNYDFVHNMTKIAGAHQIKFGVYVQFVRKSDPTPSDYRGAYNFSVNTLNPLDSGNSFSNALLGNFNTYQESNARPLTMSHMWSREFYVQDNWRATKRLTLDYGLRFYSWGPCWDEDMRQSTFYRNMWNSGQAPALYVPAKNAAGKRVAMNPLTGALEPTEALIGKLVPNSGNITNGIGIGGVTPNVPRGIETFPTLSLAPRVGFAYDVFGTGNTAIRGGFGIGYSRASSGLHLDMGANPPARFTPVSYYGNIDTLSQSGGALGPLSVASLFGEVDLPAQFSYSFGIQQRVKTVAVEVSYVGGLSRHLYGGAQINPIPMFARFDPANIDPTNGRPLQDDFLRPYRGYSNITLTTPQLSTNYNSLQVSVNRRFGSGLQFGVAYTFSKALGATATNPYFPVRDWNYGPLAQDRSHNFVFNYIYELPALGKRMGLKPLGWVIDNWQVSGITSFISGSPYTPTFRMADNADLTGSAMGPRIVVTGDPTLSKSEKTFDRTFNTSVFAAAPRGTWGNAGNGMLRGPGVNNWDVALSKRFPLWSEASNLTFRSEFFNAWNHTQFSGVNSNAVFDNTGKQTDKLFGSYSGSRSPRIIQFSLKLAF